MGVEDQGWAAWPIITGALGLEATIIGDGRFATYSMSTISSRPTWGRSRRAEAPNIGGGPEFTFSMWCEFAELVRGLGDSVPTVDVALARPGDHRVYISDTRAAADCGWRAMTSAEEGIARLAEWVVGLAPTLRGCIAA